MNIANVTERFALLSGVENKELGKWRTLIDDACAFVEEHAIVTDPDKKQTRRMELLSAAYAFRLYEMCSEDKITSFTAGDVKITSSAAGKSKSERIWNELCSQSGDIINTTEFIFGRIVI